MRIKTYTKKEIQKKVRDKTLGQVLLWNCSIVKQVIEDKKLAELWEQAQNSIIELEEYLDDED
jgi:hypothetical protein